MYIFRFGVEKGHVLSVYSYQDQSNNEINEEEEAEGRQWELLIGLMVAR